MTECEEVARSLREGYKDFLSTIGLNTRLHLAREFARYKMQGESETLIDNVAQALHNGVKK